MYKRTAEDIRGFSEKITKDMQLDLGEWLQENVAKMFGGGFDMADMARMASMFSDMSKGPVQVDPYKVLGLDKNCSDEEAKKRYKEFMSVLHPDKTQGKTDFLATLVNNAYEQICRERGIK